MSLSHLINTEIQFVIVEEELRTLRKKKEKVKSRISRSQKRSEFGNER